MSSPFQLAEDAGPFSTKEVPWVLRERLAEIVARFPNRRAVVSMYQQNDSDPAFNGAGNGHGDVPSQPYLTWTYAQLDSKAERLARTLNIYYGIRSGVRVAAFLPNGAEWVLLFWAAVRLGATFVPLDGNAVGRKDEVKHYLTITKPAAVFVGDALAADMLQKNNALQLESIGLKVVVGESSENVAGWIDFSSLMSKPTGINGAQVASQPLLNGHNAYVGSVIDDGLDKSASLSSLEVQIDLESIIYIVFTSGTSGLPKACPLTNKNIWASGIGTDAVNPLTHTSVIVQLPPPSHGMGIRFMIQTWLNGAAVVLPSAGFDAKAAIEAISQLKGTHITAIPTILLALLRQPNFDPAKTQSLQNVHFGGTIVLPSIISAATDPKMLGVPRVSVGFGMSEGLPMIGANTDEGLKVDRGSVGMGKALHGLKMRICRYGHREVLMRGETGELHVSGDMIIGGYLYGDNEPFYDDDEGHWIATGDQAVMDTDGVIFILGRYKDIIIRGGENISPALIESCLGEAGVMGQVIGVPDDIAGEIPLAVVQMPSGQQVPMLRIHDLVMDTLGPTCLPTAYINIEDLGLTSFPMTTSGKVRKNELRERFHAYMSAQSASSDRDRSKLAQGPRADGAALTIPLLVMILAKLVGRPENSIPLEQPLTTIIDSINVLRFQASIEQATGKSIFLDDLLGELSISELGAKLGSISSFAVSSPQSQRRQGPPTAADMVHTHGDTSCAIRTQAVTETLLAKHGMTWTDVEDIFPFPDLSSRFFEGMRPMAFTIRQTSIVTSTNSVQLRQALDATLRRWSMFRSLAVKFDNTALFVIMRLTEAMSQASIAMLPDVESVDQLCNLRFTKPEDNNVQPMTGGPLARFGIVNIKNTDCAGLTMLLHHSIFDSISVQSFSRDLQSNLLRRQPVERYTDYKLFADTYYQHSSSIPAQNAVAYQVNRLRGTISLRETCWPPQRCRGWFLGDDTGYHVPVNPQNSLLQDRAQVDNEDSGYASVTSVKEIKKSADLDDLTELLSKYKISAPVIFKAACAILNSRLSGAKEVMFGNTQAGRQWPFLEDGIARFLPNPITIAGNTIGLVINRIQVDGKEQVGVFLSRLEEEQHSLTKHAHAPLAAISSHLSPGDAAAVNACRRQLMNWIPGLGLEEPAASDGQARVKRIQIEAFSECMLEWHCGLVGSKTAVLITHWDGAQFGRATVEPWTEMFIKTLKWLARVVNWERTLDELD